MAATAGICAKTASCETARTGRIVAVPLGDPFVCPDCHSSLLPPSQVTVAPAAARVPMAMPLVLVGAGLFVLGGAIFLGHEIGQMTAQPVPVIVSAAAPAQPRPDNAVPPPKPAPPAPAPAKEAAAMPPFAKIPDTAPPDAAPPAKLVSQDAPAPSPAPAAAAPQGAPQHPMPGPAIAAIVQPPSPLPPIPAPAEAAKPAPSIPTAAQPSPPPQAPIITAEEPALPADQPFSAVPEAGGSPAYPAEMAADGRVGRVAVTCQIQADGKPAACRAVAKTGGPTFATATLAWLNRGHVRFHPIILHGKPLSAVRTWTVSLEEPPAALAEARQKQREADATAAPAEPAAPVAPAPPPARVEKVTSRQVVTAPPARQAAEDRPFSTHVISGGAPVFPPYYDEGRPGAVTVSCTISAEGKPSGCHVNRVVGGSGFGKAVETWLGGGNVRFRPVLVGGQPTSKQETWTVIFNEMPTAAYPQE